ncbi:MAG: hypothetical protein AAF993_07185 [Pseudomonadota bacterium]
MFFAETADPRGSLRWTLSNLRTSFDSDRDNILITHGDHVQIAADCHSDVARLEAAVQSQQNPDPTALEALDQIIQGQFLDNLYLDRNLQFEAWRISMRSRYQKLHNKLLHRLIKMHTATPAAVGHAQRLLEINWDDEAAWAQLVSALVEIGDTTEARRVYQQAHKELQANGLPLKGLLRDAYHQAISQPPLVIEPTPSLSAPRLAILTSQHSSGVSPAEVESIQTSLFTAASCIKSVNAFAISTPQWSTSTAREYPADLVLDSFIESGDDNLAVRVTISLPGAESLYSWHTHFDRNENLPQQTRAFFASHFEFDFYIALSAMSRRVAPAQRSATDYLHLAVAELYNIQGYVPEKALDLLEQGRQLAPEMGKLMAFTAWVRSTHPAHYGVPQEDSQTSWLARRAIELARDDPWVLAASAAVIAQIDADFILALHLIDTAFTLNPHSPTAAMARAWLALYTDEHDLVLQLADQLDQLGSFGIHSFMSHTLRAMVWYFQADYEQAIKAATTALSFNQLYIPAHRCLAASYVQTGDLDAARRSAAELLRLNPSERLDWFRKQSPYTSQDNITRLCTDLATAGIPEHHAS